MLATALRRLSRQSADPVVELQTNFGGGRTHSLLALYHLFSGAPARQRPAIAPPPPSAAPTSPASKREGGGDAARGARARLKNVFHGIESPWRPANTGEGFEMVRRRLFEPIADAKLEQQRDRVVKAFS